MASNQSDSPSYLRWLAPSDWFDPTEPHNQQDHDAPPSPPFLSQATLASLTSANFFVLRARTLNSDMASDASGETTNTRATAMSAAATSLQNWRSPSPTREVLSQLEVATPSLRVCQPDIRLEQPPAVRRLRSMLIKTLSRAVIPHGLQVINCPFNYPMAC